MEYPNDKGDYQMDNRRSFGMLDPAQLPQYTPRPEVEAAAQQYSTRAVAYDEKGAAGPPVSDPGAPYVEQSEAHSKKAAEAYNYEPGLQPVESASETISVEQDLCGCRCYHPRWLQKCARPVCFLAVLCGLVFVHSLLASGYISGILTTIEKRYNLRSVELGIIVSSYDLTSMIFGVVVCYWGDKQNKAKLISKGGALLAIGSFLFSLPYFIGDRYELPSVNGTLNGEYLLCNGPTDPSLSSSSKCDIEDPDTWAFLIFIGAQLIIGIGASPIFTLGPVYLYDNVAPDNYAFYVGKFKLYHNLVQVYNFFCTSMLIDHCR